MKRIAVTGAAGQIAYSLVFRIANGDLLGPTQQVALHLLDLPEAKKSLEGLAWELEDCAFPLLKEIRIESEAERAFEGVDLALLIGAKPRGPSMERKDLLLENAKIFVEQGKALNRAASPDVRVLVVGNPCNTNCLIALHYAPRIPPNQFFAMTRLDQNRLTHQLAAKANVSVNSVKRVAIWGNHSSTQVPDLLHAQIGGKAVEEVIHDSTWLKEVVGQVQKRGAAVIAARGKSSAGSAAQAILDACRSLYHPTSKDDWFSMGVYSKGNPYGIDEDLVFSFPCRLDGSGKVEVVPSLKLDSSLAEQIAVTEKELLEEREAVAHLF